MGMIYIMLIVSLVLALFFLGFFLWSAKSGQYEDDYSPSVRILYDDEPLTHNKNQLHDGSSNN
jgi:cbb3-type cytochrome oxidase maturation protein